jgi:KDO2-lipid IV(A) lauroyltransferase
MAKPRPAIGTPAWYAQHAQAAALRAALTVPGVLGLSNALALADTLGEQAPRLLKKHFRRATDNLREAYPEMPEHEVRALGVRCYQHLFRIGMEFVYTPRLLSKDSSPRHLAFTDVTPALRELLQQKKTLLITGHVGNWELIGYAISMLGFPMHAVYRPLDLAPLDEWVYGTRQRRGLTLVSKFGAVRALPPVLERGEPVGLVADQSGGDRGLFCPFFGRLTSTYKSVGILAMQSNATIVCGFARRLRPGEDPPAGAWNETVTGGGTLTDPEHAGGLRYSVEVVDRFGPEDWEGQPDRLFYITARYRRAIEEMVRRAPEQYFWMHRIWRSRPPHERQNKPFPPQLKDKLLALPWMTQESVDALIERSNRDAAYIQETGGIHTTRPMKPNASAATPTEPA